MEPAKLSKNNKGGGLRVGGRGEGKHVTQTPAGNTAGSTSVLRGKLCIFMTTKEPTKVKQEHGIREEKPICRITTTSMQERESVRRVKVRHVFLLARRKL